MDTFVHGVRFYLSLEYKFERSRGAEIAIEIINGKAKTCSRGQNVSYG